MCVGIYTCVRTQIYIHNNAKHKLVEDSETNLCTMQFLPLTNYTVETVNTVTILQNLEWFCKSIAPEFSEQYAKLRHVKIIYIQPKIHK